jgi:aryl-alcohol dehydrogenase-like predicted oxidoreductase
MEFRRLGKSDLEVSALSLGTVSLGCEYGFAAPGGHERPIRTEAVRVVRSALEFGINLFDTAPTYGDAESILGEALANAPDCLVCTKVAAPRDQSGALLRGEALKTSVARSAADSLRRLKRDRIDLLQIHNATLEVMAQDEVVTALLDAKERGDVRSLGVSVYNEREALFAIECGAFDAVQIPYSLLDQRMATTVLPAAAAHDIGLIARSTLLKGALTVKAQWMPSEMQRLREAVEAARSALGVEWIDLPVAALRFCLSSPGIGTALVGARQLTELDQAIDALERGPLSEEESSLAAHLSVPEEELVNPTGWPIP